MDLINFPQFYCCYLHRCWLSGDRVDPTLALSSYLYVNRVIKWTKFLWIMYVCVCMGVMNTLIYISNNPIAWFGLFFVFKRKENERAHISTKIRFFFFLQILKCLNDWKFAWLMNISIYTQLNHALKLLFTAFDWNQHCV